METPVEESEGADNTGGVIDVVKLLISEYSLNFAPLLLLTRQ
jgi:hypothetical protein